MPVELSYAGATLIYRLFEYYPKDRLLIIQGMVVNEQARIEGVKYYVWKSSFLDRLKKTRLSKMIYTIIALGQFWTSRKQQKIIKSFKPDIIVTVTFHLMWLQAFQLSKKLKLPLHLILHDDWLITENNGVLKPFFFKEFSKVYKMAKERYCISANMEKYYYQLFNIHGKVMLPFRGKCDITFLPKQTQSDNGTFKFCYAGSLFTADFAYLLNELSFLIKQYKGELHIFSQKKNVVISNYIHLCSSHVFFHDLVHPEKLKQIMNEEMDVAVLLNSFEHEEAFKYNFSSKLVDYTSAGIPILMIGPDTSGAISWAINAGYSAIVTQPDLELASNLLEQLQNKTQRALFADLITLLGQKEFSYEHNYKIFEEGITDVN